MNRNVVTGNYNLLLLCVKNSCLLEKFLLILEQESELKIEYIKTRQLHDTNHTIVHLFRKFISVLYNRRSIFARVPVDGPLFL